MEENHSSDITNQSDIADSTDLNGEDTTDTRGFFGFSRPSSGTAPLVVDKDAHYYKMDHSSRGIAAIFNHETFTVSNLKDRSGTQTDCDKLRYCWEKLGFTVQVHQDLNLKDLVDEIKTLSKKDYSNMDCLVICVLSHGEEGIIYARDSVYKLEDLWSRFSADNCKTLVGKPKLFFIQACQGTKLDKGISVRNEVDGVIGYSIPVHADFLFACSTMPGFFSWRNTTKGSWFIQSLCAELEENGFKYDLLTLLTFVNRRVAVDFVSNVPGDYVMDGKKQMPCISSMLTRLVLFKP